MSLPIHQLTKKELVELSFWRCSHGHNGLSHYPCWLREGKPQEKTCILDIENFGRESAPWSVILCWGIKEYGKDNIKQGYLTKSDLKHKDLDKRLVKECVDELRQYKVIITYCGTRWDIPILRSKALHYGIDFPEYGSARHIDLYYIAKYKLKVGYCSLKNNCEYLHIPGKTNIDPSFWLKAITSANKVAVMDILDHNEKDLIITEKLFDKLRPYTKIVRRSI